MPKYPEKQEFSENTVFDQLLCFAPFYENNNVDSFKSYKQSSQNVSKNNLIKNAFLRKKSFKRVFCKSKFKEIGNTVTG